MIYDNIILIEAFEGGIVDIKIWNILDIDINMNKIEA